MLGTNLIVEDAVVGPSLHESCSQEIYMVYLHRRIGLFYHRKQQEKLYKYFTIYYTYVCPTQMSALTKVNVSSFRSDTAWHLQDRVALKLLPQNFSNPLKSFLICAAIMSPHDVVLALAFNHDTDWLPVTLHNFA
jgi:hypothetical protein